MAYLFIYNYRRNYKNEHIQTKKGWEMRQVVSKQSEEKEWEWGH